LIDQLKEGSSPSKSRPKPGPLARQILDNLAEIWSDDHIPIVPTELGFDWWAGHFKVSLIAHSQVADSGDEETRLVVRTDFLKNVLLEDQQRRHLAMAMGGFALLFAWLHVRPKLAERFGMHPDGKVWLDSVFYLNADNASAMTQLVSLVASLQAMTAEFQSEHAAKLLRSEVDVSSHGSPAGDNLHPALCLLDPRIKAASREPCPLTQSEEFAEIALDYGKHDLSFGTAGPGGVTLETPIGDTSALVRVRTDVAHPSFGNGLLASLELPFGDTEEGIAEFCSHAKFPAGSHLVGRAVVRKLASSRDRPRIPGGLQRQRLCPMRSAPQGCRRTSRSLSCTTLDLSSPASGPSLRPDNARNPAEADGNG
jgi:hypothetical protein